MRSLKAGCSMVVILLSACAAYAHPGSGIAVDDGGNVYFVHAQVGIWKVDSEGNLVRHEGPGYHFLSLDARGGGATLATVTEASLAD